MLNLGDVLAHLPPPVRAPFKDPAVTEVMLNSDGSAWYERGGRVEAIAGVEVSDKEREAAAVAIARPLGFPADEAHPLADARLPDGSRVAVTCPPVVLSHEIVVRRFGSPPLSLTDLVRSGSVDLKVCEPALEAIGDRKNVLVSGGTSSGKTTLLQALAGELHRRERVIVIEDTRELDLAGLPNCSRWEARRGRADDGLPSVTVRRLVRHALRARPDRIFVGEVRGSEALDLLQALNTGHGGSLSTIHAPRSQGGAGEAGGLRHAGPRRAALGRGVHDGRRGGRRHRPRRARMEHGPAAGGGVRRAAGLRPADRGLDLGRVPAAAGCRRRRAALSADQVGRPAAGASAARMPVSGAKSAPERAGGLFRRDWCGIGSGRSGCRPGSIRVGWGTAIGSGIASGGSWDADIRGFGRIPGETAALRRARRRARAGENSPEPVGDGARSAGASAA